MGYATTYLITFLVISFIGILFYLVVKCASIEKNQETWNKRNEQIMKNIERFEEEWREKNLHADFVGATKAYHTSKELKDLFNLRVDYTKKVIGICSFESEPYTSHFFKFEEIASFEILNGTSNSTSTSYSTGGAIGTGFGAVGAASTDTHVTNTIENLRLKIETTDPYKPGIVVCLFYYQVDTSSGIYRMLLDSVEEIRSVLGKIVLMNNKSKEESGQ